MLSQALDRTAIYDDVSNKTICACTALLRRVVGEARRDAKSYAQRDSMFIALITYARATSDISSSYRTLRLRCRIVVSLFMRSIRIRSSCGSSALNGACRDDDDPMELVGD